MTPEQEKDPNYLKIALEVTEKALKEEKRQRAEDWGRYLRWFPHNAIIRLPEFPDWKLRQIIVDKDGKEWCYQGLTLHRSNTGQLVFLIRANDTLLPLDKFGIELNDRQKPAS